MKSSGRSVCGYDDTFVKSFRKARVGGMSLASAAAAAKKDWRGPRTDATGGSKVGARKYRYVVFHQKPGSTTFEQYTVRAARPSEKNTQTQAAHTEKRQKTPFSKCNCDVYDDKQIGAGDGVENAARPVPRAVPNPKKRKGRSDRRDAPAAKRAPNVAGPDDVHTPCNHSGMSGVDCRNLHANLSRVSQETRHEVGNSPNTDSKNGFHSTETTVRDEDLGERTAHANREPQGEVKKEPLDSEGLQDDLHADILPKLFSCFEKVLMSRKLRDMKLPISNLESLRLQMKSVLDHIDGVLRVAHLDQEKELIKLRKEAKDKADSDATAAAEMSTLRAQIRVLTENRRRPLQ